jgi:sortase A
LYKVAEIKTVASTAGEVEAPTDTDQLTLYTCTPLWSAKERLVIVAKPIGGSDE